MARPKSNGSPKDSTATIGFEAIFRADIGKEHADTFRHVQHSDLVTT